MQKKTAALMLSISKTMVPHLRAMRHLILQAAIISALLTATIISIAICTPLCSTQLLIQAPIWQFASRNML